MPSRKTSQWKSLNSSMSRSEEDIQKSFVTYLKSKYPGIITSSTGNFSSVKNAAKNVRMGYTPGFPDIAIFEQKGAYAALFIELKKPAVVSKNGTRLKKSGTVSSKQKKIISRLKKKGYYSCVAYGLKSAKRITEIYMNLKNGQIINLSEG